MTRNKDEASLSKYEVMVTRVLESFTTVEVEAYSLDEAKDVALAAVDDVGVQWVVGNVIVQSCKGKVTNG